MPSWCWYAFIWVPSFFLLFAMQRKEHLAIVKETPVLGVLLIIMMLVFAPYLLISDLVRKTIERVKIGK